MADLESEKEIIKDENKYDEEELVTVDLDKEISKAEAIQKGIMDCRDYNLGINTTFFIDSYYQGIKELIVEEKLKTRKYQFHFTSELLDGEINSIKITNNETGETEEVCCIFYGLYYPKAEFFKNMIDWGNWSRLMNMKESGLEEMLEKFDSTKSVLELFKQNYYLIEKDMHYFVPFFFAAICKFSLVHAETYDKRINQILYLYFFIELPIDNKDLAENCMKILTECIFSAEKFGKDLKNEFVGIEEKEKEKDEI